MQKQCGKCKRLLDLCEFSLKSKDKNKYHTVCKECHKKYRKQHYSNNIQKYKDKAVKKRKEYKDWYKNLKNKLKCIKCGEDNPWCLQFHHINPENKIATVAKLVMQGRSPKSIQLEIDKCEVLCANCHLKQHYNEFYQLI